MNRELSEKEIRKYLKNKDKNTGILIYKSVASTNDIAKEKAKSQSDKSLIILSEHQSAGRGRMGRRFFSPEGSGLYMSIMMKPAVSGDECIFLTLCAACAVCKALDRLAECDTEIKWVNDILLQGKKVCGILTEAEFDNEKKVKYAVIGMGINVTGTEFNEEIKNIATSVEKSCGKALDRNELAAEIINNFFDIFENFNDRAFFPYYKSKSAALGKTVKVISHDGSFFAEAFDIDEKGRLAVKYNGEIIYLNSGEIRILL